MPGAGGLADVLGKGEGPRHCDSGISGHGTRAVPGCRVWSVGIQPCAAVLRYLRVL